MEPDDKPTTTVDEEVAQATDVLGELLVQATAWTQTNVLTLTSIYQLIALATAFVTALMFRRTFIRLLDGLGGERTLGALVQRLIRTISAIALPVCWAIGLWISVAILEHMALPFSLLRLVGSLLNAFILIRTATIFIPSAYWSAVFAWTSWSVAALNSVGLLDPAIDMMRETGVKIGEVDITLWTVVKGVMVSALLIWFASVLSEIVQRRLENARSLNSALRLLIAKILRIVLVMVAIVAGLTAVGVDLTAFAVFSGAIGLGIGLGLQRTVSNMVAGFSLLADSSLKPGDVIEFETAQGPTYGVVRKMTTRYVAVRTRDGTETLIPNEILISGPVTNWTHSDHTIRRKIPIGISYESDVKRAIALCVEAAAMSDRVLKAPKPVCLLRGFGDSSVNLELRIWINDPDNGVSNIASEIMINVWERFHEHGIDMPFPQRDLHLRSAVPLVVQSAPSSAAS